MDQISMNGPKFEASTIVILPSNREHDVEYPLRTKSIALQYRHYNTLLKVEVFLPPLLSSLVFSIHEIL
jgi:hypothetical protein